MSNMNLTLTNGNQTATFADIGDGNYRPEWFRTEKRPMLRFKDHEWLNIGGIRVTDGQLRAKGSDSLLFGGREFFGGTPVDWQVRVSLPADKKSGFTVYTELIPVSEPIEVLEAMTSYETPYEYDGNEHSQVVMCQQPVYRNEGGKQINGAGWMQPLWYYGRVGRAHLTYQCSSPLMAHRVKMPDGSNSRCVMLIGNWDVCSVHDMFAQPTRNMADIPADKVFADSALLSQPGRRGMKYLIGTVNWNNSLYKDPNVLVEPGSGLKQEVTVDFRGELPDNRWDGWMADGWERLCRIHFPKDGKIGAYEVAKSRGASWVDAAQWLADQCAKPEGCPGFFNPECGTNVYAPHTRPKWDNGNAFFSGQFTGPMAYLGQVWKDPKISAAAERLEIQFEGACKHHDPSNIWTIGFSPMYAALLRKAKISGLRPSLMSKLEEMLQARTNAMLNPSPTRKPDAGMLSWEAFVNLLAADIFSAPRYEAAAKELLTQVNARLENEFWSYNCCIEGDLVGAGQARPFGHAIGITANCLAGKRFKDPRYLDTAVRFANLFLGMHCIAWNESPAPDLDTRGWCHGSTGGRDQIAQIPPWETGFSMEQLGMLLLEGRCREGLLDVLWLFSHTGLAQFPKARTLKRLYRPDMSIVYRSIDSLATEREFYLKLPYLAYENPWDQTMLACYQGVEPLQLSLFIGGGLAASSDDRVAVLVPQTIAYDPAVSERFTAYVWNPIDKPVETKLIANVAQRRAENWQCQGAVTGQFSPGAYESPSFTVPSRKLITCEFRKS